MEKEKRQRRVFPPPRYHPPDVLRVYLMPLLSVPSTPGQARGSPASVPFTAVPPQRLACMRHSVGTFCIELGFTGFRWVPSLRVSGREGLLRTGRRGFSLMLP